MIEIILSGFSQTLAHILWYKWLNNVDDGDAIPFWQTAYHYRTANADQILWKHFLQSHNTMSNQLLVTAQSAIGNSQIIC